MQGANAEEPILELADTVGARASTVTCKDGTAFPSVLEPVLWCANGMVLRRDTVVVVRSHQDRWAARRHSPTQALGG